MQCSVLEKCFIRNPHLHLLFLPPNSLDTCHSSRHSVDCKHFTHCTCTSHVGNSISETYPRLIGPFILSIMFVVVSGLAQGQSRKCWVSHMAPHPRDGSCFDSKHERVHVAVTPDAYRGLILCVVEGQHLAFKEAQ